MRKNNIYWDWGNRIYLSLRIDWMWVNSHLTIEKCISQKWVIVELLLTWEWISLSLVLSHWRVQSDLLKCCGWVSTWSWTLWYVGPASQSVRALVCLPFPFYHGVDLWYSGVSKKMSQEYSFFLSKSDFDLLLMIVVTFLH